MKNRKDSILMFVKTAKVFVLIWILLLVFQDSAFAGGQGETSFPVYTLEYVEDNDESFKITTEDGQVVPASEIDWGWQIPPGSTLETGENDYVELLVDPDRAIIRISENTKFKIERPLEIDQVGENVFALARGKFRAILGSLTAEELYLIRSPHGVCGVRGTDFGMEVIPNKREIVFVLDGKVEYTQNRTGKTIEISNGMISDVLESDFQSNSLTEEKKQILMTGLKFKRLDPSVIGAYMPSPEPVTTAEISPLEAEPEMQTLIEHEEPPPPVRNVIELSWSCHFEINTGKVYFGRSVHYVYQLNDLFSLGGWIGVENTSPLRPLAGIKGIIGDRNKSFAFSVNLGAGSGIGLYWRNVFLNISIYPSFTAPLGLELGTTLSF